MARLSNSKNFRIVWSMQLRLMITFLLVFVAHGSGVDVTAVSDEEYVIEEDEIDPSLYPSIKIFPKALFGALKWKVTSQDLFMARCNDASDCDAGIRMICLNNKCGCKPGDLFLEWPKFGCFSKAHMFGPCEVSGQCVAVNPYTYCNPDSGRCTCSPNYFYNGRECSIRYDGNNMKAQEVYKAAVVAAACFIVAVVGIFVACIVRRSFCRRDPHLRQSDTNTSPDVFSISDEIAAMRAVDKPPSYEEVLQIERTFYGIPPPEYSASRLSTAPFHPPTTYSTQARNLPPSSSSSNRDCLKSLYQESAPAYSREEPPPVVSQTSGNFLADVEVLSPPGPYHQASAPILGTSDQACASPTEEVTATGQLGVQQACTSQTSDVQETSQSEMYDVLETLTSSQCSLSHYISSTPPPPRLHRQHTASSSSSLPGSPNLSSVPSRFMNLFRKDLLKDNIQSSPSCSEVPVNVQPPEHHSPSHVLDISDNIQATELGSPSRNNSDLPVSSISSTLDRPRDGETSHRELAYDNLGFVSDLYV
ncbi:hypothetical protein JTE90_009441 [Oedothorax gibbosus]|uniref:EGF-like domain-containing protein n=1 Tax=Oedothorax gibbosus TaxID=931172 RepID=A0AAV6VSH4_9ARAC|nr:hypothetical protein JTE90_009441 [Oedothorax gibbosus]